MAKVNTFFKEVISRMSCTDIEKALDRDLIEFETYINCLDLKKSQKKELKRLMKERHWFDMSLNDYIYDLRTENLMMKQGK